MTSPVPRATEKAGAEGIHGNVVIVVGIVHVQIGEQHLVFAFSAAAAIVTNLRKPDVDAAIPSIFLIFLF